MAYSSNDAENSQPGITAEMDTSQAKSQDTQHPSVYPDPDDLPTYPWLSSRSLEPLPPSFDYSNTHSYDEEEANQLSPARNDPNDSVVDPDFQFSEESVASDEFISEAGSRSPTKSRSLLSDGSRPCCLPAGSSMRRRGRGGRKRAVGRGAKGVKRGPRKPLEPNVEFKALHAQATMAFIAHDYDEAERLALKAVKYNPEMYAAHSLLSEIHVARGDHDKALTALFNGAHTRPGDAQGWLRVAELILNRDMEDKQSALPDAIYCLSRVINIEQDNVEARYQRASLNRDLGFLGRAATEYEQLLRYLPHDTAVLRQLAEIYIELDEIQGALQHFDDSIAYHETKEPVKVLNFSWSDVNIYTELYGYQEQYELGVFKLKYLSRWLLGRKGDDVWATFNRDDREWDAEDHPRRIEVNGFVPGIFAGHTYGFGLPLELRVKLGVYRLRLGHLEEAMNHFQWLSPDDYMPGAKLFDYTDLFREAADALRAAGQHNEALRYYEPLQEVEDYVDSSYLSDLAFCYREAGFRDEAEECYQSIVDRGDDDIGVRLQLITMCKEHGASERSRSSRGVDAAVNQSSWPATMLASRSKPTSKASVQERGKRLREQQQREQERDSILYSHFLRLERSTKNARFGDAHARAEWTAAAKYLIQDFRSNSIFYPTDKYMRFLGYSSEARARSAAMKPSQKTSDTSPNNEDSVLLSADSVPDHYRGITFQTWLNIFLEYAFYLSQDGNLAFSYDIILAARDANVFYHALDSMLLIHICWFACALLQNDDATLCNVCRWFMREYQFVTDGYRLFGALNRLCDTENTWFNCGPSQKHVLRQIKAVDFSLIGDAHRKSLYQERAGYNKDGEGNPILATEMDIALLMLYGQILYAGRSFTFALNYFFRAYALDPNNPMINLSIALSYIHHALKRQADNRHHLVAQGLAFLSAYRDLRLESSDICEKQEAEYNTALAYHSIGLTHLAVRFYERCLDLRSEMRNGGAHGHGDEFSSEAAFALQALMATSGDYYSARQFTEEWLVIE